MHLDAAEFNSDRHGQVICMKFLEHLSEITKTIASLTTTAIIISFSQAEIRERVRSYQQANLSNPRKRFSGFVVVNAYMGSETHVFFRTDVRRPV